jgi:hypothetical protein
MAKSRRKNGGPTRGRFKLKKLGKGWSTQRRQKVVPKKRPADSEATKPA